MIVMQQYSRQYVVDELNRMGYAELADEAQRVLPDPVDTGLVTNLARPGANVTGFTAWRYSLSGKWLEFLKEADPRITRTVFMYNPNSSPFAPKYIAELRDAGAGLGLTTTEGAVDTVADFENYKKRTQRDMDSIVMSRHRMLLERFLPVLDNLERALDSKAGGEKLRDGLEQTLRGFEALLASEGVKAIDVKGKPFDPRVAEAIATRDAESEADDTVVEVAEKGYSLGEELLRPAKVIVAKHVAE